MALYIPGDPVEIYPNVFVEKGTKICSPHTLKGKMQHIAFTWARVYTLCLTDLSAALELLDTITLEDSQLYYPSQFGFVLSRDQIRDDVTVFASSAKASAVWFPKNGWCFDKNSKRGVIGADGVEKEFLQFTVEVQFRQTTNQNTSSCTNDNWSFFLNPCATKFYQLKEWLDGRVRRLQAEIVNGVPTLSLDVNNVNVLPWPPVSPGKEQCITPVTVRSGCLS